MEPHTVGLANRAAIVTHARNDGTASAVNPNYGHALKRRRTRRGKSKRGRIGPYPKLPPYAQTICKPEAPYNSNQFLIEDHGNVQELDEKLRNGDGRARDSSISMESDEMGISADEIEENRHMIEDFTDEYERMRYERVQQMPKDQLIDEFLAIETKLQMLTKHIINTPTHHTEVSGDFERLQREVSRLRTENESLRQENYDLRGQILLHSDTDSNSSDSCSSTPNSTPTKRQSPESQRLSS